MNINTKTYSHKRTHTAKLPGITVVLDCFISIKQIKFHVLKSKYLYNNLFL